MTTGSTELAKCIVNLDLRMITNRLNLNARLDYYIINSVTSIELWRLYCETGIGGRFLQPACIDLLSTQKWTVVPEYLANDRLHVRMNANCHSIKEINAVALSSERQFRDTFSDRSSMLDMYMGQKRFKQPVISDKGKNSGGRVDVRPVDCLCFGLWGSIYLRGVKRPPVRSVVIGRRCHCDGHCHSSEFDVSRDWNERGRRRWWSFNRLTSHMDASTVIAIECCLAK